MSIESIGDDLSIGSVFPITPKISFTTEDEVNARVGQVYLYTAAAFAATCATAAISAATGLAGYVVTALTGSPLLCAIGIGAVAISLIFAIMRTPKENLGTKQGLFGLLSICEGIALSPLVLISAPACAIAALTTIGITGGLGFAAMKMKTQFERYEKILLVALGVIGAAALGTLFLPAIAAGIAHKISLFGGLALFSAFIIYDTQQARAAAASHAFDPINHSVGLYYDVLNVALRIYDLVRDK